MQPIGGLTLSRAMTTSAAALNTGMGTMSNGIASIFIGMANMRMGTLLFNPRKYKKRLTALQDYNLSDHSKIGHWINNFFGLASLYFLPFLIWWPRYYLKSLLSNNSREDFLLDISDGGHIENLAVFELLKRECKLIIGFDNGMDGNYQLEDLKNLIKRAEAKHMRSLHSNKFKVNSFTQDDP